MPFDNPPQAPFGDAAILMDARRRVADPSRWLKHGFQDGDRHCLVAALSLACDSPRFDNPNETERRLAKHLAKQMPLGRDISRWVAFVSPRHGLMAFTDHRRTRHDDVMALFDRQRRLGRPVHRHPEQGQGASTAQDPQTRQNGHAAPVLTEAGKKEAIAE